MLVVPPGATSAGAVGAEDGGDQSEESVWEEPKLYH